MADREFPKRVWLYVGPEWAQGEIYPNEDATPYLSMEEHEALLEIAVNAETARCLLICEEQKKEERSKVFLAAGNAISMAIDYQFGNETKIEALAKVRDHLWNQAKEARENG